MTRGWLKNTVKGFNTALVSAGLAVKEQSQGVSVTIRITEGPISGHGSPVYSSDISVRKHMSAGGVVSLVQRALVFTATYCTHTYVFSPWIHSQTAIASPRRRHPARPKLSLTPCSPHH